jgi:hypothetical protein
MPAIDGILGMSTGFTSNQGPIFLVELARQNVISNAVFGFYLTGHTETSFLDIGMLQTSSMRDESELVWMNVDSTEYWWSQKVKGMRLYNKIDQIEGEDEIYSEVYRVNSSTGLTDTGTSCVYVPTFYYEVIINDIK